MKKKDVMMISACLKNRNSFGETYGVSLQIIRMKQIFSFYQSLFSRQVQVQTDKIDAYLDNIPLPKLTSEQTLSCEGNMKMKC